MNSDQISSIIAKEIGGKWDQSNAHGVDLHTCLIKPEKRIYADGISGKTVELWLVLEEDPKGRKGYKIVFDEDKGWFGLAMTQKNGPEMFLGYYGTFMETLEGM